MKEVNVLCEDKGADYGSAFKYFAETEMKFKVNWISKVPKCDKYILLFKVETRIPEDVRRVIKKLGIKGERLGNNTMIVAMHCSEGENPIAVSNFIGSPDDPLYSLKLSNTFYNKTYTPKCDENDEAKRIIVSFLKR